MNISSQKARALGAMDRLLDNPWVMAVGVGLVIGLMTWSGGWGVLFDFFFAATPDGVCDTNSRLTRCRMWGGGG